MHAPPPPGLFCRRYNARELEHRVGVLQLQVNAISERTAEAVADSTLAREMQEEAVKRICQRRSRSLCPEPFRFLGGQMDTKHTLFVCIPGPCLGEKS